MEITSAIPSYHAIPAQKNTSDNCSKVYEECDSDDNGLLTANEVGSVSELVSISNVIPEESIETQKLQEELVSAFENFQENNNEQPNFTDFLKQNENFKDKEVQEDIFTQNNQNAQPLEELSSMLYHTVQNQENKTSLSSYAPMMDMINEQTQPPKIREQLQAYTQSLRL